MDPAAAKFIGAGLAAIGMIGAGIGVGNIFGNFLSGAQYSETLCRVADVIAAQVTDRAAAHRVSTSVLALLEEDSLALDLPPSLDDSEPARPPKP